MKHASLKVISGNQQSGLAGRRLSKPIELKVTADLYLFRPDDFFVTVKKPSGGGHVTLEYPTSYLRADKNGIFTTTWSLGCDRTDQTLTFYLHYLFNCSNMSNAVNECTILDSVTVAATASTPPGWNVSCGTEGQRFHHTKITKYNNSIYAVISAKLYRAKRESGFWWEEVLNLPDGNIFDFGVTNTGRMYVLTWGHGIYSSDDLQTWTSENNGIPDQTTPSSLLVEDSVVYASFGSKGLYRLRPSKSNSWTQILMDEGYTQEYRFITRHPDGRLYLVDSWNHVRVSENFGDTWVNTPIGDALTGYYTEDFKIDPSGVIYIGSLGGSLSILASDTYTGTIYRYSESSTSSSVKNIAFDSAGTVYYLVKGEADAAIYSSAKGWQELDVNFDKPIHQFVIDEAGTWFLESDDGIYYWKE